MKVKFLKYICKLILVTISTYFLNTYGIGALIAVCIAEVMVMIDIYTEK